MGFSMDPLSLVIPFFITARSVSHSVQMHDRYYEEYRKWNWNKEKAIIAAFAELFVPTISGIIADALGMLAIIVVPVVDSAKDRDFRRRSGSHRWQSANCC